MPELEDEGSLNLNESVSSLVGFLIRRRWWILLPFCCVTLAAIAILSLLPDRYMSTATLLVVQQQVPQRYVVPNSETDVTSALQAMKQEVLSRTQLLRMINEFGLYLKQRKRLAPEELVSLMLRNIDIVPINDSPQQRDKDFDAFRISFTTENAVVAQQVTNTLTSLFINEYIRTGAEQSTNTTNFLHQQVEEKGKLLEAQEERLRDFKMQHVGELPEQQQGNLGIMTGLQGQLQNTMASLNRAQQQRALLQAQLDATPRRRPLTDTGLPVFPSPAPENPARTVTAVEAAQNELTRLQTERDTLRSKGYTSIYPDVQKNEREIANAEEALQHLRAAAKPSIERPRSAAQQAAPSSLPDSSEDPAVVQLKSSLEVSRLEILNLTNDENRLKAQISQYENRINQIPVREQQQASIVRDTEVLRQQYGELQKKEQESQLATNLEKQQGGRQFRLIDPASLPSVPSSPKRVKLSLGGASAGIVLGLVLALVLELRDTSFRSEAELTKHLALPFALGIPCLPTPLEKRQRRLENALQWLAASAMLLVVFAAEFYIYKRG